MNCICGREFDINKPHCPKCGRSYTNAVQRLDVVGFESVGREELIKYKGYRCRACGHYFNTYRLKENCEAPPLVTPESKQQKRIKEATKSLAEALSEIPGEKTEQIRLLISDRIKQDNEKKEAK